MNLYGRKWIRGGDDETDLKKKLRQKSGFTLIEMLTVTGIIAILVAVSIPVVSNSLVKAQHTTDAANERAAKSAAVTGYLMGTVKAGIYIYDAAGGKLVDNTSEAAKAVTAYGKHNHDGMVIEVEVRDEGDTWICWETAGKYVAGSSVSNYEICNTAEVATHENSPHALDTALEWSAYSAGKALKAEKKAAGVQGDFYCRYNLDDTLHINSASTESYGNHSSHVGKFIEVDVLYEADINDYEVYVYWTEGDEVDYDNMCFFTNNPNH